MTKKLNRSMIEPHKCLNLNQLYAIRDNQYRNKDCTKDYYPELVDERIWMKEQMRGAAEERRLEKEMEIHEGKKGILRDQIKRVKLQWPKLTGQSKLKILRAIKFRMNALGFNIPYQCVKLNGEMVTI